MIFMSISEEYGCQEWYAVLSDDQFENLKKRWMTIKGLNCLVPVNFIIEQAKPLCNHEKFPIKVGNFIVELKDIDLFMNVISAHIHESDDSGISGIIYEIPESEFFEIDGIAYTQEQISDIFHDYRIKNDIFFDEIEKFQEVHFTPLSKRK